MEITNAEISQKLTNRNYKHTDLDSIVKTVRTIALRNQEMRIWNERTTAEKNNYFKRCQTAAYRRERAENYKTAHSLEDYENLRIQFGLSALEDAKLHNEPNAQARTAISLLKQASRDEKELAEFNKIDSTDLSEQEIIIRAVQFHNDRCQAKLSGDWEAFNNG